MCLTNQDTPLNLSFLYITRVLEYKATYFLVDDYSK